MPSTTGQETVEKLIEWMKQPSTNYTQDWSAVAAYDREKANLLLQQEYIERYDSGEFIKPSTGRFEEVDPNEKTYLSGVTFDPPRLSFENSTLQSSRATLTWKAVDGATVNLSSLVHGDSRTWRVVELNYQIGLASSKLIQTIELETTSGGAEGGEVYLDILKSGSSVEPRYTAVSIRSRQVKAARELHALLANTPGQQTRFVLNTIKSDPQAFFDPTRFGVRVHPSEESTKDASGAAQGAVLVFISSHNQDIGSFPNPDNYKFMIPQGYTATLAVARKFMLRRFIELFLKELDSNAEVTFTPHTGVPELAEVRAGKLPTENLTSTMNLAGREIEFKVLKRQLDFMGTDPVSQPLTVKFTEPDDGAIGLQVAWKGSQRFEYYSGTKGYGSNWMDSEYRWDYTWNYAIELVGNDLEIKELPHSSRHKFVPKTVEVYWKDHVAEVVAHLENEIFDKQVRALVTDALRAGLGPLNTLRLNQMLFRSEAPVALEDLHMAQAPVVFGQVSPARTRFWLKLAGFGDEGDGVQAGSSLPLTIEDAMGVPTSVTWSIETIFGLSETKGEVTGTGLQYSYKAPSRESLVGGYAMVRLSATATFPGDEKKYTSSTLIKVYANHLYVSPQVRLLAPNQSIDLKVEGLGGGKYNGRIDKGPDDGASQTEVLAERDDGDGYNFRYTSPNTTTDKEPGNSTKPKTIEYRRLAFSQEGADGESDSYVVVPYHGEEFAITVLKVTEQGGKTQVELRAYWSDGEALESGYDPVWSVPIGVGEIEGKPDGTAVLTLPTEPVQGFSVVEVRVLYENTYAVSSGKSRPPVNEASSDVLAPPKANPDYVGVRIFPAPWFDVPDPKSGSKNDDAPVVQG
ncbi:hypothetical protein [Pseudomonas massiliensis]|uniref:hypothetical protein n=1 Tax=Pseudomonas massiliensis TaxID=522492 RepID=UPI00058DC842|nr:hypothetical protein [Pseudomonas massiliensis]